MVYLKLSEATATTATDRAAHLTRAERLLREVQAQNNRLPADDPTKPVCQCPHLGAAGPGNYALQGNRARQAEAERELEALPAPRP